MAIAGREAPALLDSDQAVLARVPPFIGTGIVGPLHLAVGLGGKGGSNRLPSPEPADRLCILRLVPYPCWRFYLHGVVVEKRRQRFTLSGVPRLQLEPDPPAGAIGQGNDLRGPPQGHCILESRGFKEQTQGLLRAYGPTPECGRDVRLLRHA